MISLQYIGIITIFILVISNKAAIIQNPKLSNSEDGFLELKPNGSLILRSTMENSSNALQQAIIFKTILNAIRLQFPLQPTSTSSLNTLSVKIYGDGVEHKFPPFLERVIQRIQTYFSIYKYTDTSQPQREENKPTTPPISALINETLTLNNEIDIHLTSDHNINANPNKISSLIYRSSTTTPPASIAANDASEENEFIEIKKKKIL